MQNTGAILASLAEIEQSAAGMSSGDEENINLKIYAAREELIKKLDDGMADILRLHSAIVTALAAVERMKTRHSVEKALISSTVGRGKWSLVSRRRPNMSAIVAASLDSKYTRIKITDSIHLPAIVVATFEDVRQDGQLYYISSCGHFAVKILGVLFHGNIGNIFIDEKSPEKIKNCRFAEKCIKNSSCDYYHDPRKHPGSQDRRNFIASSFLYTGNDIKKRGRGRRFGSLASLDADIIGLQPDEIVRFRDQVMHDILCMLVAASLYSDDL